MDYSKKLSIVIPVYNTEKYLKRCLDRLLEQTYNNIEIIIVNDASTDSSKDIIMQYQRKDNRIIYVEHEKNKGLFHTRIDGAEKATGEYIAFLDSDDYVTIDFYRTLMINIQENNSDIAMGKTIFHSADGTKRIMNFFDCKHHFTLENEEILDSLFKQKGLSFDWHTIWNKIYKKEIWDKALPYYSAITEHHIMTEDLCFSLVLFYFAKKLTFVQNDGIFYCQTAASSTKNTTGGLKKVRKNIEDIKRTFDFMRDFLKQINKYDKYEKEYLQWRALYKEIWKNEANKYELSDEEKRQTKELLDDFYKENTKIEDNAIYNIQTDWNGELEKIKLAICDKKIKCVSFDMFDTLVQRPFIYPTDLFDFLNKYFLEIYDNKTGINFKKIRIYCENMTRKNVKKIHANYQDITIDEIYKTIEDTYYIEKDILEKLKNKEKELEIRFCSKRKTGYELYTLALALGKKVIITSDMYLDRETLVKILDKNGYNNISKIYLSSEARLTKATGDLYKYVLKTENLKCKDIIHIGDNYSSDVLIANKYGIKAMHLIKALDVAIARHYVNDLFGMLIKNTPSWEENTNALNFLGIRCMMGVFVNNYFDNPYTSFNLASDFNSDPYLIGYFALGMYMFGVTKWMLDDVKEKKYDRLVFMARDGYLPMETYKIMKKSYKSVPDEEYLYVSRKSLIPVIIRNKQDFYKLSEFIKISESTPKDILKYLKDCIIIDEEKLQELCKINEIKYYENFKSMDSFCLFIKIIIDNFYNQALLDKNQIKLREYFLSKFRGKSAIFDVGYSARPELYLSQLCDKTLDTYFLNINEDTAQMYSKIGNFDLKVFFDGKPALTGYLYETIISAIMPSCIGYDLKLEHIEPIFEEYNKTYQEEFFVGIMQNASIQFIQDIVDIFDKDMDILFYEKYYTTLPIMAYINSSRRIDRVMFDCIFFEDDVRLKERKSLNYLIETERRLKNQVELHELIDINSKINDSNIINRQNVYVVDLNNRSKLNRLIFYANYNRPVFRQRMKEIFGRTHIIYPLGRMAYKGIKQVRDSIIKIRFKE